MIADAHYIKDCQLEVIFSDRTVRHIDLLPFLSSSTNPLIRQYLNPALFARFRIENGTICWGDNDFDLNPHAIYEGKYDIPF